VELALVVGHERRISTQSLRGDPEIIGADRHPFPLELGADATIVQGRSGIDTDQRQALGEFRQSPLIAFKVDALLGAELQFAQHDGGEKKAVEGNPFQAIANRGLTVQGRN
jgi:hypothetical protein